VVARIAGDAPARGFILDQDLDHTRADSGQGGTRSDDRLRTGQTAAINDLQCEGLLGGSPAVM
jgi:hypothetical protein